MKSKTQALLEYLDEMATILESHGEQHWSQWIRGDAARLRRGDMSGVQHFLSAFGGMGSLNDRFLCPENSDQITKADVASVNARLSETRSEAWSLARALLNSEPKDPAA
ncbi:MAG TPA: hypothetical protein VGR14_18845 [Verrucomicrobiae bacterium]|jgi:hypothetical protein|nr:hypothetical protein [Verrucomicrobiae bacterium]